jgi:hypothetical protein
MPDWKREVRAALAGAKVKADAAREEAVVEELAQDLADRYEDLRLEGAEEEAALRRLRGDLRVPGFLVGLRPRLEGRHGRDRREQARTALNGSASRFAAGCASIAVQSRVRTRRGSVTGPRYRSEHGDFLPHATLPLAARCVSIQ